MEAQQRLYSHLRNLNPEQMDWIEALLVEKEQALPDEQKVIRAQAVSINITSFSPPSGEAD